MARNFEAELEALEEKRKRILKAKEVHEVRNYVPIGRDIIEVFPDMLSMKAKERAVFIVHLRKLYDAEQQHLMRNRPETQSQGSDI